jgi:hypothetical protein
MPSTRRFPPP